MISVIIVLLSAQAGVENIHLVKTKYTSVKIGTYGNGSAGKSLQTIMVDDKEVIFMKYIIKPVLEEKWMCYCSDCNDCSNCGNCSSYSPCNVCKTQCGCVVTV